MSPDWDVERIRADFPILGTSVHDSAKLVYLDNAASTQRPQCVIDALNDVYTRTYANVHRGSHWLSDQSTEGYELAREAIAKFVGAQSANEIVFTTGTTGGINLVARSWGEANIEAGDEVLLTEMEHHSNIVPWQQLSERTGCRVRFLPLLEDGRLDMEQLPNMLSESTRMFAFAAVSNVTGAINPVGELVEAARAVGATTLVDAAQAVPHQSVDFEAWGVDFAVFSGHKMLGPSGIGALYGRETLLDEMPPFLGGGSMIREVTLDGYTVAALPAKFEAGTPPIANAIVMRTTIEYLEQLDLSQVIVHERRLAQRAHEHTWNKWNPCEFSAPAFPKKAALLPSRSTESIRRISPVFWIAKASRFAPVITAPCRFMLTSGSPPPLEPASICTTPSKRSMSSPMPSSAPSVSSAGSVGRALLM